MDLVRSQLAQARAARKCHACGCLHQVVAALEVTEPGRRLLAGDLAAARQVLAPQQYDCLGCAVCYPALAANAFVEAFPEEGAALDLCPAEAPAERAGWPALPGNYRVLRYGAPVAVCALNSEELAAELAALAPEGLSIVGTLHTENLGIERIIRNVEANPHLRCLVLCGEDTRQAIGHLPGQSLASLFEGGVDERGRIRGARGRRPVLKNVTHDQVAAFVRQIRLVDRIGETNPELVAEVVASGAAEAPGPFAGSPADMSVPTVETIAPRRLVQDPAGYCVVYPDPGRGRLRVEHYQNSGTLDCVLEGETPAALYAALIERGLLSRLDHAAYLGRELARAERALATGEPYVQDRAAGEIEPREHACGCTRACGAGGSLE